MCKSMIISQLWGKSSSTTGPKMQKAWRSRVENGTTSLKQREYQNRRNEWCENVHPFFQLDWTVSVQLVNHVNLHFDSFGRHSGFEVLPGDVFHGCCEVPRFGGKIVKDNDVSATWVANGCLHLSCDILPLQNSTIYRSKFTMFSAKARDPRDVDVWTQCRIMQTWEGLYWSWAGGCKHFLLLQLCLQAMHLPKFGKCIACKPPFADAACLKCFEFGWVCQAQENRGEVHSN